jgi:coenzyme Q-binding protein COQ10
MPKDKSETAVSLGVEYNFSNPLYNTLAQQFAPQVAGRLVQAFEARVEEKLGQMVKSQINV